MFRRLVRNAVLLVAVAYCAGPWYAGAVSGTEYEIKAAFIYNFTRFVRWPGAEASQPLAICVLGADPFAGAIERAVAGRQAGARRIDVVRVTAREDARRCDIVFIAASEAGNLRRILDALDTEPVLTVADFPGFAERGGMIGLVTEGNRVRFEINVGALERSGLKASSQLLGLATIVGEK